MALVAAVLVAFGGVPASADDDRGEGSVFGTPLQVPRVGPQPAEDQELPPTPELCSSPPSDAAFMLLGRHPGPQAVAYHSGQRVIDAADVTARAPFPELHPIGDLTLEPNIGVTSKGAVFVDAFRCASALGGRRPVVLRSTDEGSKFQDVSPQIAGQPARTITEDPYLYVDPHTDRVFSTDIDKVVTCEPVSFTADAGASWDVTGQACGLADHESMFAGPPPRDGTQPSGYPDVVYYCAIDAGALAEISKATTCVKSLDGGVTFVRTGQSPYIADPAITANNPTQCDGGTGPGFVDARGTVYLPRGFCGQPYLAISRDEGQSWRLVQVSDIGMGTENDDATANVTAYNHEAGVRVDRAGTIYYTWVAHDRLPYLSISRDGAKTWSRPAMIGPPGVRQAWNPAIDLAPSGRLALAYMASTNAPSGPFSDEPEDPAPYKDATFNGYITVTDDASAPDPTYYTASVNAPSHPFIRADPAATGTAPIPCGQVRCGQEFDFIDLKMGPDETPWAIFIDACGTGEPKCRNPVVGAGVAARLVPPNSAAGQALFGPGAGKPGSAGRRTPLARRCASRRHFRIRVHRPRGVQLVSAEVFVNGRRIVARKGRRLTAPVDLRHLPRGRFTVTIKARTKAGRTITGRRRYRTCVPKRRGSRHHT